MEEGCKNAPLNKFFYITLGLGAGGHGDFPNDVQKPWQNTAPQAQFKLWKQRGEWIPTLSHPILEVDYVRICATSTLSKCCIGFDKSRSSTSSKRGKSSKTIIPSSLSDSAAVSS